MLAKALQRGECTMDHGCATRVDEWVARISVVLQRAYARNVGRARTRAGSSRQRQAADA
jgi:hypothetical protein